MRERPRRVRDQSLGGRSGCERAIKRQVSEIDNFEATVNSITLNAAKGTATAAVNTIHAGKKRVSTVKLVKEGGRWKVSALG